MAFNSTDNFVSGGPVKVYDNFDWTTSVYKFSPSSFSNWEFDNLPLYDLDERTLYLWYKSGFPTSTVPGVTFTLSGSNGDNIANVFTSLETLNNYLPEVINYPLLVEVAASGALCGLKLNNIKFGRNGSLEIVNRMFGQAVPTSSTTHSIVAGDDGLNFISGVSSIDLQNTIENSSAVEVSTNCYNAGYWNTFHRAFFRNKGTANPDRVTVVINDDGTGNDFLQDETQFFELAQIYSSGTDSSIQTYDVHPRHAVDATVNNRNTTAGAIDLVGLIYGNTLSSVEVKNCNGPIYLRGFCVDGTLAYDTSTGFDIENSKLYLENCAAIRCYNEGFGIKNSNVTVMRGMVGYRNYNLSATGVRENIDTGAGLRAIDSVINFSDSGTVLGEAAFYSFDRNAIGLDLKNSYIKGGTKSLAAAPTEANNTHLCAGYNSRYGVLLDNSVYNVNGRIHLISNKVGVRANNSMVDFDLISVVNQDGIGLEAYNSDIQYNKNEYLIATDDGAVFNENAQHLVLVNSEFKPKYHLNMPAGSYRMYATSSHGIAKGDDEATAAPQLLPSFEVRNNSYGEFVSLGCYPWDWDQASTDGYNGAIYGLCLAAKDYSKAVFRGWYSGASKPTALIGPSGYGDQNKTAGVYAGNHSTVEFTGPTKISRFGVDVLAEDHSTIKFNPPRDNQGNIDVSGWDLINNTGNHTKVELHATRACLVVNKNSILEIKDLGDWKIHWENGVTEGTFTSSVDLGTNATYRDGESVSAGYMVFYPNPQVEAFAIANPGAYSTNRTDHQMNTTDVKADGSVWQQSASGGVCVRAANDSLVDLKNINFYGGDQNPSGYYYDASGDTTCNRLLIWNICDNSQLKASYLSLSGAYPNQIGYAGPSSVYLESYVALSGAPAGTPDTNTLSILDHFGGPNNYSASAKANYGLFRLYFSTDPLAKWLIYDLGDGAGKTHIVYQALSQGYNPSGDVSAAGFHDIFGSEAQVTGFYYSSGMISNDIRVWVDESAANTFANAKHCSIGKSGNAKVVAVYRARASTERGSEAYSPDAGDGQPGTGLRSVNIFDLSRDN